MTSVIPPLHSKKCQLHLRRSLLQFCGFSIKSSASVAQNIMVGILYHLTTYLQLEGKATILQCYFLKAQQRQAEVLERYFCVIASL